FLAPFHPVNENPTLSLQRDFELIERLDRLGYDEAWIGEHHSAGYEIIASPEIFIAAAAERTRHIRFGTGVSSVPYHHPLMVARRGPSCREVWDPPALHRRDDHRRLQGAGEQLGDLRRQGARARPARRPRPLAARRADAHRRDA